MFFFLNRFWFWVKYNFKKLFHLDRRFSEGDLQLFLHPVLVIHATVVVNHDLQLHLVLHAKGLEINQLKFLIIYLALTFLSSFCSSFFFLSSRNADLAELKTALVRWVSVRPQVLRRQISWSSPPPVMTGIPVFTLNETFSSANCTIGW